MNNWLNVFFVITLSRIFNYMELLCAKLHYFSQYQIKENIKSNNTLTKVFTDNYGTNALLYQKNIQMMFWQVGSILRQP